jgi:predicted small lipoprotein YifL
MKGLSKIALLFCIMLVVTGCGQKGSLYLPSEQIAQLLGL